MAFLLVGDRGHAEDLLQTALLRTALNWRRAAEHPEAYARRVLVNLARDRWRAGLRQVAERSIDSVDGLFSVAGFPPAQRDHADAVVDQQALLRALATLPRRQREVVVLRFFVDLTIAETALAMRTSEGTVKSQTSRALDQLRRLLGDRPNLEEEKNHA
jgi:RNA polymerase sigma-70 factor (sigma-E family)